MGEYWVKGTTPILHHDLFSTFCSTGGGFTTIHQDGNGTVDSGHTNLQGYNEIVMLRRLPEKYKIHACSQLTRKGQSGSDVLYTLPHAPLEGGVKKLQWPTFATIKKWEDSK